MRASLIVRQLCTQVGILVHQARFSMVLVAVDALLRGGRLTLTCLGRWLEGSAMPKHRIKRVDRFLGNSRVHREIPLWYRALAARLLANVSRPVVLVDWTQTIGSFQALVAAVPFLGRAIPIYAEVHPHSLLGNRRVHDAFLARLGDVLSGRRPIIVADAGFRTPFFASIQRRGWDFVIRLRGAGILRRWSMNVRERDPRLKFRRAFAMATEAAQCLGRWRPYASNANHSRTTEFTIVLGARSPRGANQQRPKVDAYQRRALEPWLLATTLKGQDPHRIVALYAMRMQIEETFRDTKNARLGWALEHAGSHDTSRQSVLLLVASLALAATLLAGAAVERRGGTARLQANTVRKRRVLSLYRVGAFALSSTDYVLGVREVVHQRRFVANFRGRWVQLRLPHTRFLRGKWC